MQILTLATIMWALAFYTLYLCRNLCALGLYPAFVLFSAIVGTFYPVSTVFLDAYTWRIATELPTWLVLDTQLSYCFHLVGLCAAAFAARFFGLMNTPRNNVHEADAIASPQDTFVVTSLLVVGIVLYCVYIMKIGIISLANSDSYSDKYLNGFGLGYYSIGINLAILGSLWGESGSVGPRLRAVCRAIGAVICLWTICVLEVRTNAVILILGHMYIQCVNRRLLIRYLSWKVAFTILTLWLSMECLSINRTSRVDQSSGSSFDRWTAGQVVGGSEFAHPFFTFMEVRYFEDEAILGGKSYLEAPLTIVPLSLLPGRPTTLSEQFVWKYYPDMAALGKGAAFTLVGEEWLNCGDYSIPFFALLSGYCLILIDSRLAHSFVGTRILPYSMYLIVIAHRSTAAIIFKMAVISFLPAILLLCFCPFRDRSKTNRVLVSGDPLDRNRHGVRATMNHRKNDDCILTENRAGQFELCKDYFVQ